MGRVLTINGDQMKVWAQELHSINYGTKTYSVYLADTIDEETCQVLDRHSDTEGHCNRTLTIPGHPVASVMEWYVTSEFRLGFVGGWLTAKGFVEVPLRNLIAGCE